MSLYLALLQKEFRQLQGAYLFWMGATLLLEIYGSTTVGRFGLSFLPLFSAWVLPFLIGRSFQDEWKSGTQYFLMSLPVPRFMIVLCKALAVLGVGVMIFIMTMAGVQLGYWGHESAIQNAPLGSPWHFFVSLVGQGLDDSGRFWKYIGSLYFAVLMFLTGLMTLVQSIRITLKRHQKLVSFLTIVISGYLYFELWFYLNDKFPGILIQFGLQYFIEYSSMIGVAYLCVAMLLFEWFAEV